MKGLSVAVWFCLSPLALAAGGGRVELTLDASEAEATLAILAKRAAGQPVGDADWQRLFGSEPYARLKKREASLAREFGDESFKRFVLDEALQRRAPELRRTLAAWQQADLQAAGQRLLSYLPAGARIQAKVYPVVKPRGNSFVFETTTDPAIFLYLDPELGEAAFANTVAHELHHIGLASVSKDYDERIRSLPENARTAAGWMGAFGEGLAVLAAAGSPDVHPLAAYGAEDRARWDQDLKYLDQLLGQLDQFFLDVLRGGFARNETVDHVAFTFFGYRGPWYTVGYQMGAVVERRFGRAVLLECMADPRLLLARYNQAALARQAAGQEKPPTWSAELLEAVGAGAGQAREPPR